MLSPSFPYTIFGSGLGGRFLKIRTKFIFLLKQIKQASSLQKAQSDQPLNSPLQQHSDLYN